MGVLIIKLYGSAAAKGYLVSSRPKPIISSIVSSLLLKSTVPSLLLLYTSLTSSKTVCSVSYTHLTLPTNREV